MRPFVFNVIFDRIKCKSVILLFSVCPMCSCFPFPLFQPSCWLIDIFVITSYQLCWLISYNFLVFLFCCSLQCLQLTYHSLPSNDIKPFNIQYKNLTIMCCCCFPPDLCAVVGIHFTFTCTFTFYFFTPPTLYCCVFI